MVTAGRLTLLTLVLAGELALAAPAARAQWWTAAPGDFEECAERAERSGAAKDAQSALLADCEAKFAGRRKHGGGYTYYDFMQNRHFDIAGPNPTAGEQKQIDEQYTVYLDEHRRSIILAAFAERQRQQDVALPETNNSPVSVAANDTRPVLLPRPRPRIKTQLCTEPLACGWSRFSSGLKELKDTLFGAPAPKTRRS
jgi:hypothetical protein